LRDQTPAGQLIDVLRQADVERVYAVVGDSLNLHRFVRRRFAIYSVRGHASAGSNRTPRLSAREAAPAQRPTREGRRDP
jgi:hypothetical protein